MIKKSLSLVLIAAIIANLVMICLGHSHGSSDSHGQSSHVHLFGHGHDHSQGGIDGHAEIEPSVSETDLKNGQGSNGHSSDVVYLNDWDWRSTRNQEDTNEINEIVVFFVSHLEANSASHSNPTLRLAPQAPAHAPAHFLETIRLLL